MLIINDQKADIFLGQPDVNSNVPYPFMLWKRVKPIDRELLEEEGPAVSIQIEVNQDADPISMDKAFFFTVLLKDHQLPTGEKFTEISSRENLYEVLGKGTSVYLQTSEGTYSALESDGFVITETQYENYALAAVRLSAKNAVFLPAPNERFTNTRWLLPDLEDIFFLQLPARLQVKKVPLAAGLRYLSYLDLSTAPGTAIFGNNITSTDFNVTFQLFKLDELTTFNDGDIMEISRLDYTTTPNPHAKINLRWLSSAWEIQLIVVEDDGTVNSTAWYPAPSDAANPSIIYTIEMASSGVAGDGEAKLSIDQVLKETMSNLQVFDAVGTDLVTWGIGDGIVSGMAGFLVLGNIYYTKSLFGVPFLNWEFQMPSPGDPNNRWGPVSEEQGYWR